MTLPTHLRKKNNIILTRLITTFAEKRTSSVPVMRFCSQCLDQWSKYCVCNYNTFSVEHFRPGGPTCSHLLWDWLSLCCIHCRLQIPVLYLTSIKCCISDHWKKYMSYLYINSSWARLKWKVKYISAVTHPFYLPFHVFEMERGIVKFNRLSQELPLVS